jgi:hypothetical protein
LLLLTLHTLAGADVHITKLHLLYLDPHHSAAANQGTCFFFFFFFKALRGCGHNNPLIDVPSSLVLQVILPFEHVVSITKDSTAFVIPNAIEVIVQSPGSAVQRQVRQTRP